jgi:hypothetical protein
MGLGSEEQRAGLNETDTGGQFKLSEQWLPRV